MRWSVDLAVSMTATAALPSLPTAAAGWLPTFSGDNQTTTLDPTRA